MSADDGKVIRIHLVIEIPTCCGTPRVTVDGGTPGTKPAGTTLTPGTQVERLHIIQRPGGGNTPARGTGSGPHVICATGTSDGVRVYAKIVRTADLATHQMTPCPQGAQAQTNVITAGSGIGTWSFAELTVAAVGESNTLILCFENTNGTFDRQTRDFTPFAADHTECDGGSRPAAVGAGERLPLTGDCQQWATMSKAWRFTLEGKGPFAGTWAVQFDAKHPDRCRWVRDVKGGVWRLQFVPADGYWYLDFVRNLDQPPGAGQSYRRHASAWHVRGSNALFRYADGGAAGVPDQITLVPV